MKSLPKTNSYIGIKNWFYDMREDFQRNFPGPMAGIDKYGLGPTQVYPNGKNLYASIKQATASLFRDLHITTKTPVASIGTCFAEEFAGFMKNTGGNYLLLEDNVFNASANWGRVYTIPNLHQIISTAFSQDVSVVVETDGKYVDPLREKSVGFFSTRQDAIEKISAHRHCSRQVFESAEVLVITLGQNEAWEDCDTGLIWGSIPPGELRARFPERFRPVVFDIDTCRQQLSELIACLQERNPVLKIILTVSPVAAYATFLSPDVVTQSMEGKCMLRTLAGEITRKMRSIYYFPSFELVLCLNPHTFNADNRHVKRGTVYRIFSLLNDAIR